MVRSTPDLGKVRSDTIRRGLLAPLPGECKYVAAPTPKRGLAVNGGNRRPRERRIESNCGPTGAARHWRNRAAGPPVRIALYEPDIPQNTGTILRLCACLGIEAHIIGPAGFPISDRAFRRAGMDYLDAVTLLRHASWHDFASWRRSAPGRLILFTTGASQSYLDQRFAADDILLFGRESAGVPPEVHAAADARLRIPMRPGLRSLNVAMAAAIAAGEALRQVGPPP
jgi:tRNA (cytidine/uridine-2'-O-)-methyltransferase